MKHIAFRVIFPWAMCAFTLLSLSPGLPGATLIFDNFDSVANGASINGRAPTVNTINASTWVAPGANIIGNGSGGLSGDTTTASSAALDLGSNYLSANPGVYQLSANLTQPSGIGSQSWIALGIGQFNANTNNLASNNGTPWLLFRLNGNVNFYGGPNTTNQLTNNGGTTVASTATFAVQHLLALTLDTTLLNWTLNGSIDGVTVDLNGTAAAGNTFVYTTNPTTSRYIQLSTGNNGANGTGTFDNFLFATVPEPGRAVLLAGALLAMTARRRRQHHMVA